MEEKINIQDEMKKDTMATMDTAFKELASLMGPVAHNKLKYSEAAKFIESGALSKSFFWIKRIVECHRYLREFTEI